MKLILKKSICFLLFILIIMMIYKKYYKLKVTKGQENYSSLSTYYKNDISKSQVKDICELCDGTCLEDHSNIDLDTDIINSDDCRNMCNRKICNLKYINIQSSVDDNYLEFSGIDFKTFTKPRSNYRNVGDFEFSKDPQKWVLVPITSCYYYIKSLPTNKDIPEYYLLATKNGNVGVSLFGKSTNQKWLLIYNESDDTYYIKSAKYNTYL